MEKAQRHWERAARGFTLIELMIVVAIISILASVAIPRFANLMRKSSDGATKGNLGAVRSALSIYYGDNAGFYPVDDLSILLSNQRKYIDNIPPAKTHDYHPDSSSIIAISSNTPANISDAGGWLYVNNMGSSDWGNFLVNCTDTDLKGNSWTSY